MIDPRLDFPFSRSNSLDTTVGISVGNTIFLGLNICQDYLIMLDVAYSQVSKSTSAQPRFKWSVVQYT